MSSNNGTDVIGADCKGRETFPIYLLSFVYSLLAALIIAHLICRWQLRRRKLSRFRSSQAGDKSFKSKAMRDILKRDFSFIQALSCDPRLTHKDSSPQVYGKCSGESGVPDHWYRMAAFDAAADFVSAHAPESSTSLPTQGHAPLPHPHQATPLSNYLRTLNAPSSSSSSLAHSLTELYQLARYKDGEFGKDKLQLFQEQLESLREILRGSVSTSVTQPLLSSTASSSPVKMPGALYRQSTTTFSSQDPLLRMSSTEVMTPDEPSTATLTRELVQGVHSHPVSHVASTTVAMPTETTSPRQSGSLSLTSGQQTQRSGGRQQLRAKKPGVVGASESEISPLVTAQMSPASPPISTLFENVFEEATHFAIRGGDHSQGTAEKSLSQPWQKLDEPASMETQV